MEESLDHAPAYYWEVAENGLLLAVNQTLCEDLGYLQDELAGKHLEFISTMATRIFCQTHLFPLLQLKGDSSEIFISLLARDRRSLPILCNVKKTIRNGTGIVVYAGIAVENRKKFEDELIEARKTAEVALLENSALIQAKSELEYNIGQSALNLDLIRQQNGELRQFNHVVTHVLREPIRKITIFSNMLADADDAAGKDPKMALVKLLRATEQIRFAVEGLQQYAWVTESSNEVAEIDVHSTLLRAKTQLEKENPQITLELIIKPIPLLIADPVQTELLLYHILSNAIGFRRKGNAAVVHVEAMIIQQNQLVNLPGKYKYSDYLKMEFRDEGIGFDPVHKDQIFELFIKLQHSARNGIGLALCKKIVENHHGTIMADSVPGEGTTITVLLPVAP
jgi:sigma-B regulation protein RsbU (phosphoserine phosphatase)